MRSTIRLVSNYYGHHNTFFDSVVEIALLGTAAMAMPSTIFAIAIDTYVFKLLHQRSSPFTLSAVFLPVLAIVLANVPVGVLQRPGPQPTFAAHVGSHIGLFESSKQPRSDRYWLHLPPSTELSCKKKAIQIPLGHVPESARRHFHRSRRDGDWRYERDSATAQEE